MVGGDRALWVRAEESELAGVMQSMPTSSRSRGEQDIDISVARHMALETIGSASGGRRMGGGTLASSTSPERRQRMGENVSPHEDENRWRKGLRVDL